jgi:hypothetical protein
VDWVAAIGCYRPLHAVPGIADVAARVDAQGDAPGAAAPLWRRLVRVAIADPLEEAALRPRIEALTPIRDDTSLAVAAQYEENPYPRWFDLPEAPPLPWADGIRMTFPHFRFGPAALAPKRILVAGCGSG